MKSKLLFTTASLYYFLRLAIFRIVLIGVSMYLLFHFKENSILIGVLLLIALSFFLFAGQDVIEVYEDRFLYRSTSLLKRLTRNREFIISELAVISYDGSAKPKVEEGVAFVLLQFFVNNKINRFPIIYIEFKGGRLEKIDTDIYREDIAKAVSVISKQISRHR